jgi:hypothetical protein
MSLCGCPIYVSKNGAKYAKVLTRITRKRKCPINRIVLFENLTFIPVISTTNHSTAISGLRIGK